LLKQAGSKAKPTATGGLPGTLTNVMTGQIDIGWAVPPFALRELQENKIVIVARARDATELRNQTIRVNISTVEGLRTKRAAITRLMQVYDKAINFAYSNPKAIDYFAEFAKVPHDIAKRAVDEFYPKEATQIGEIRGIEMTLRDALQYKFTTTQLTPKDVEPLFDIVYKPAR
jgi:NitT/TauT family transport system substrate-binding protein